MRFIKGVFCRFARYSPGVVDYELKVRAVVVTDQLFGFQRVHAHVCQLQNEGKSPVKPQQPSPHAAFSPGANRPQRHLLRVQNVPAAFTTKITLLINSHVQKHLLWAGGRPQCTAD